MSLLVPCYSEPDHILNIYCKVVHDMYKHINQIKTPKNLI